MLDLLGCKVELPVVLWVIKRSCSLTLQPVHPRKLDCKQPWSMKMGSDSDVVMYHLTYEMGKFILKEVNRIYTFVVFIWKATTHLLK